MRIKGNYEVIILFVIFLVSLIFITSCIRQYVCYNGDVKSSMDQCPKVPAPYIDQKIATSAVQNYGEAYSRANNNLFTMVNIYSKNTTWFSDVLFTDSRTNSVSAVTLSIDGKTASVSCISGCQYIVNSTVKS